MILELQLTFISLAKHEMRLILANIVWNFDLELYDQSDNWLDQKVFTLWKKGPLMVKVKSIKD